jgi:hypothetical protein
MDNEPIIAQDGTSKNDCERSAAKRLLNHMQTAYGKEWLVWVMDALYSCGPVIRQITQNRKWQYVIGIKPDGNKRTPRGHCSLSLKGAIKGGKSSGWNGERTALPTASVTPTDWP